MTARFSWNEENTHGHRPRLQSESNGFTGFRERDAVPIPSSAWSGRIRSPIIRLGNAPFFLASLLLSSPCYKPHIMEERSANEQALQSFVQNWKISARAEYDAGLQRLRKSQS